MSDLFAFGDEMRRLLERAVHHAETRISHQVESLQLPPDPAMLAGLLNGAITDRGIGPGAAFDHFTDVIAPAN